MPVLRALVVEDDVHLASLLKELLRKRGLDVDVTHQLGRGLELIRTKTYTLGIVDRVLPDGDGLTLVEQARHAQYPMRILILSGQSWSQHRVAGLEQGASDYLTKPFSYKELELRVRNLILSDKRSDQNIVSYQGLALYPLTGELVVEGEKKQLRPRETAILACMLRHREQLITREVLLAQIWGSREVQPNDHTLDVYIRRIRSALGTWGSKLHTIRGFGYRLE